ncbi:MAG TPA: hypothetical protein VGG13_00030 [Candidatus Saccharimonadales bacterium]|jgi:hypothetical protein
MNPNIDKLPAPDINPADVNADDIEVGAPSMTAEKLPSKEAVNVAPPPAATSIPQTVASVGAASQIDPIVPVADDVTLSAAAPVTELDEEFEKKWVNVAKAIVGRTKDDPHLQSQELSKTGKEYREKLQSRS